MTVTQSVKAVIVLTPQRTHVYGDLCDALRFGRPGNQPHFLFEGRIGIDRLDGARHHRREPEIHSTRDLFAESPRQAP